MVKVDRITRLATAVGMFQVRLESASATLKRIQWCDIDADKDGPACPWCMGYQSHGHDAECPIALEIARIDACLAEVATERAAALG